MSKQNQPAHDPASALVERIIVPPPPWWKVAASFISLIVLRMSSSHAFHAVVSAYAAYETRSWFIGLVLMLVLTLIEALRDLVAGLWMDLAMLQQRASLDLMAQFMSSPQKKSHPAHGTLDFTPYTPPTPTIEPDANFNKPEDN